MTSLGKRIYRDRLTLERKDEGGRRLFRIYGQDIGFHEEAGTDLAAVAAGSISVTPIHFDLTDRTGLDALTVFDLSKLLAPAVREVE